MLALNIPDLSSCAGVDVGGLCTPWLLVGLLLGTLVLGLTRSLRALGQRARVLDGLSQNPPAFAGIPPRVSLVRLAPTPDQNPRRRAKQRPA